MEILSYDPKSALKSPSLAFFSSSPMIPRVSKRVWGESGVKQNEGNGVKNGFTYSNPAYYCSWDFFIFFIFYFWVFLQNYSFATTLSNSVYRTTLMFFDVPDSFLMLF